MYRFRAKREHLERFEGLSPERQGQNLALNVLHVPYSLDDGYPRSLVRNDQLQTVPPRADRFAVDVPQPHGVYALYALPRRRYAP